MLETYSAYFDAGAMRDARKRLAIGRPTCEDQLGLHCSPCSLPEDGL